MKLHEFFISEGIPLYTALPFEYCKIINPRLLERTMPNARSVLLFILPYYTGKNEGNLSLYARCKDYHLYAKELGKNVGTDAKRHKNTFLSFYTVEEAQAYADMLTQDAVQAIAKYPQADALTSLAEWLASRKH